MFGLPFGEERKTWIRSIPYLTEEKVNKLKKNPAVCIRHWPTNYPQVKNAANGTMRPAVPPSIFEGIPQASIPTPPPPPRTTTRTSFMVRMAKEDEVKEFLDSDRVTFEEICQALRNEKHKFTAQTSSFATADALWVVSTEFCSGIPEFSLKIKKDQSFEGFRMGAQCTISTLSKNRITKLDRWSKVDEAVRFLSSKELNQYEKVIKEQIHSMKPQLVGKKVYDPDTLRRAFTYYATSRTLYRKLRKDYKLPGEKTLSNLTSKVNKLTDRNFLKEIFEALPNKQKECVVIVDEMHVKSALLLHGGTLFGKAKNKPDELATATLDIMVKCLKGGPTFMLKMIPVTGLDAEFQFEQVNTVIDIIKEVGGTTKSLIVDGNRINQAFYKMFETVPGKPWLTVDGMFLLFDFVHLLKSIRNNWLTEKTGSELQFTEKEKIFVAKWEDLLQLYHLEKIESGNNSGVRGLSKLTEVAVTPKPVERQRVTTCLRVFCEETLTALKVHPSVNASEGTYLSMKKVVDM